MGYDLVIKGGRVFDPGQGLNEVLDIAITAGRIAAIQKDIPVSEGKRHIVVKGPNRYVIPGLIDLHTHVAYGVQTPGVNWQAAHPELAGVHSGVTTVVDCGTTGAYNFGIVPTHIIGKTRTRLICFLNIGSYGLLTQPLHAPRPEVVEPKDIDLDSLEKCIETHRGIIKGIKVRLVGPAIDTMGEQLIRAAKEASRNLHLPVMVHIGDLFRTAKHAPALTRFLLKNLDPRDIVTHICTAHAGGLLDESGRVIPEVQEARARGVIMDPASGRNNFNYHVAQLQAEQGFHPDTISTDMSTPGRGSIVFSLMESMAKFMALGYTLEQVVRMTTANPARALGMEDTLGAIAVGREADLTIMDMVTGTWRFTDAWRQPFTGDNALVPVHTVRAGELIAPDWGPHPWGWLPEEA